MAFSHRSFLRIGSQDETDFESLATSGIELEHFDFSFQQGIDDTGKASTEVYGGNINIII